MAEKEASYETATGPQDQQKASATVLHLPSLTSKPTRAHNNKQLEAERTSAGKSADSPSDYYLNVAQKGKLILPTALWILLILAGVAFLGLLASLSRTIDTLDTLVELEQEKEARASVSEHLARHAHLHAADSRAEHKHKHQHQHKTSASRDRDRDESLAGRRDNLEFTDTGSLLLPEASWFSLPSWTSLEPAPRPSFQRPNHDEAKMLMPMPDGVTIEISGDGNGPMPPAGLINSIMSQVMPMLDGFMGPPPQPLAVRPPMQQAPPMLAKQEMGGDDLGAMISAKIDNLNINLNAANNELKHHKTSSLREEEIKSLESSVDDLVAKLMAQKLSREPDAAEPQMNGAHHTQPHQHHEHASKVDEIMPVIRLPPPPRHSFARPPGAPFSPLASLLMGARPMGPMGDDSSTMIIGPFNSPAELESMLAAGPGTGQAIKLPPTDDGQVVISLGGPGDLGPLVSGELNRHGLSNTKRPSVRPGSPYELAHPMPHVGGLMPLLDSFKDLDEMMRKADSAPSAREPAAKKPKSESEAKWDMLSNDLADVLLQGALGEQQTPKVAASLDSTVPKSDSIVVVNGKQLEGGERDKFLSSIFEPSSGPLASETKSPLSDMISAMFEPTRTTAASKLDETPQSRATQTTLAPISGSPPTIKTLEPISSTASKSTVASDAENSATDMVNNLLSTMFAMPQFSAGPQQASTNGSQSSSSGSATPSEITTITRQPSESSSSSLSTQPAAAATTTTTTTQAGVSSAVTRPPSLVSITTPESVPASMLSTLIEALHTPHLESELAKDSLLRDFLGMSSPKEGETPQQVITTTTTTAPTTATSTAATTASVVVPTTATPTVPTTTTTTSPALAEQSGARVIREQDAPTNLPIFDLGPYAGSTLPSIENVRESSSPTMPTPTLTPASASAASSTAIPITTTTPNVAASSTLSAVTSPQANLTTGSVGGKNSTTERPPKSFFQRADDFIERNLMNFKRFF